MDSANLIPGCAPFSAKREPLGKSYARGFKLPNGLGTETAFGVPINAKVRAEPSSLHSQDLSAMRPPPHLHALIPSFSNLWPPSFNAHLSPNPAPLSHWAMQDLEKMGQVKNVVFPTDVLPDSDVGQAHDLYVKTHGAYNPGEQRRRQYDWPSTGLNPATHSFGAVDKDNYQQGVKKALQPALDQTLPQPAKVSNKIYEDFKAQATDYLGKPRKLGAGDRPLPPDHVYGLPSLRCERKTAPSRGRNSFDWISALHLIFTLDLTLYISMADQARPRAGC